MKRLIFLFAIIFFSNLSAEKYNLSVCAVFKNEAKHLKEWIEFHKLIGVDHFYLYSSGSTDYFYSVLEPYIRAREVDLYSWPDISSSVDDSFSWYLFSRVSAYENACKIRALRDTKWLVFLDIDEYLLPVNEENIQTLLKKYEKYPGIILSSDFYNASKKTSLPAQKLLIESQKLTKAPFTDPFQKRQKIIFKPAQCISFTWPPFKYNFKNNQKPIQIQKKDMRINRYLDRGIVLFEKKNIMPIDHRLLSEEELLEIFEKGYEIEDQEKAINRFIPIILKRMGHNSLF